VRHRGSAARATSIPFFVSCRKWRVYKPPAAIAHRAGHPNEDRPTWVENQIRPIAIGRSNWLFAGSFRAGHRAAAVISLLHSARLNGHDPYVYMKYVLERLPTQPASRITELLPHRWRQNNSAH
jgi:hypothetical protein